MLLENQYLYNKSIMVSVLGVPNVGKSSLINAFLGFDLSAVTHKPQTTRNKFHCALTIDHTEIIFVDTPGIHRSTQELNRRINSQAKEGAEGADLNLLLIDPTQDILEQFHDFLQNFKKELGKTWVIFTKADLIENKKDLIPFERIVAVMKERVPSIERWFVLSSKSGDEMHSLTGALCDEAKPGPHLYPDGAVSNKSERFFVTEYIREQAFQVLEEELPYELAVVIEEYTDMREQKEVGPEEVTAFISASILVNRPSQRAIVVGKQGSVIKQIGTEARKKIETMIQGRVHLKLHVKVQPKWFKNNFILEELGLPRAEDSVRVWKKRN